MDKILTWIADNFSKNASKMLIVTGVAGWTLSSIAQIGAILFNPNISKEQKSFLIPQECADALVNIGSFFAITQLTKMTVSKLFSTGKFASSKVRAFLDKNTSLYKDKIGKIDFDRRFNFILISTTNSYFGSHCGQFVTDGRSYSSSSTCNMSTLFLEGLFQFSDF